jgi:hypothetical protein
MTTSRALDNLTRRQQRLALIDATHAQGTSLLSAATQDAMKTRVRGAMLDLDNARGWLTHQDDGAQVLQVVDTAIGIATRKMAVVAKALEDLRFDVTG